MISEATLLNQLPDLVFVFDPDGTPLEVNQVALTRLGYEAGELNQLGIDVLLPEESIHAHHGYLSQFKRTPSEKAMLDRPDLRIRAKNGELIPALISITPLYTDEALRYLVIVRDLTNVRKNEKERQLRREIDGIEQRYQSLERLVTHMLDDINNSLMLLEGHSKVLLRTLGGSSETSLQVNGVIHASKTIQNSMQLLESLLGVVEAERELMEPVAVISEYVGDFKQRYKQNIELQTNDLPTGLKIYVARQDIELAFTNILQNATEASQDSNDAIKVCLRLTAVTDQFFAQTFCLTPLEASRTYLEIAVSDKGLGLSSQRMSALFRDEPAENAQNDNGECSREHNSKKGIGIPAALSAIRALGGTVCVDRFRSEGARVSILVPALGIRNPAA